MVNSNHILNIFTFPKPESKYKLQVPLYSNANRTRFIGLWFDRLMKLLLKAENSNKYYKFVRPRPIQIAKNKKPSVSIDNIDFDYLKNFIVNETSLKEKEDHINRYIAALELKNLIEIIPISKFKPDEIIMTDIAFKYPYYKKDKDHAGTVKADLIIDNKLIDIKTCKEIKFDLIDFIQLIKYYLWFSFLITEKFYNPNIPTNIIYKGSLKIEQLGIYYARYGYLWLFNIDDIYPQDAFKKFISYCLYLLKNEKMELFRNLI